MKKIIITSLLTIASIFAIGQANTYFHDRIDTTIFVIADTVGHGANNYFATNNDPNFNIARYENGLCVNVFIKHGNSGTSTFQLHTRTGTLPKSTIENVGGLNLLTGDLKDSSSVLFTYYNTRWHIDVNGHANANNWLISGNSGTTAGTNFQGTIDSVDAVYKTNNIERMRIIANGGNVGINKSNATAKLQIVGNSNTNPILEADSGNFHFTINPNGTISACVNDVNGSLFIGIGSGDNHTYDANQLNVGVGHHTLKHNTTGAFNTAIGGDPLETNTTGSSNVAIGKDALDLNTIGSGNTAIGYQSMLNNTTANNNTALGFSSLTNNLTHTGNVAIGFQALNLCDNDNNTAVGYNSLSNCTAIENTAVGRSSGLNTTTGYDNCYFGLFSGNSNITGFQNCCFGANSNFSSTAAFGNSIFGFNSGQNNTGNENTFFGYYSGNVHTSGDGNLFLGSRSGRYTTGSNKLILNAGFDMGSEANDKNNSLIYGVQGAAPANNQLQFNALHVNMNGLATYANNAAALAGGLVAGDMYLVNDGVTGSKIIEIVQ